jgi:hypothetical protein
VQKLELTVEEPIVVGGVALFPLISPVVGERSYVSGPTALADGTAVIHELDGGEVPTLVIETHGSEPVLLVEGELLVGGRQNRVVNVTVLCPPGMATTVPVSCVEAGRWGAEQPMTHSRHHSPGSLRAAKTRSLRGSEGFERRADQRLVWQEVSRHSVRANAQSPTDALESVYGALPVDVEEKLQQLEPMANQVGVAFVVGGRVVGVDIFDRRSTLADYLPALTAGYVVDAIGEAAFVTTRSDVEAFIARIEAAEPDERPGIGLGTELSIHDGLAGVGLRWDSDLLHLAAYPG